MTSEVASSDYSAAHSMDTEWFAVDSEGNIGLFETGEAGVIPLSVTAVEDVDSFSTFLDVLSKRSGVYYEVQDLLDGPDYLTDYATFAPGREVLMVARNPSAKERVKKIAMYARDLPGRPGQHLLYSFLVDKAAWNKIQKEDLLSGFITHALQPSRVGLFSYVCEDYEYGEPYERSEVPAMPLNIKQVPSEVCETFLRCSFANINFAIDEKIFPRRYFSVFSWDEEM